MSELILELNSGLTSLVSMKERWTELFRNSSSKNPFLSWEWNFYWASKFAQSKDIKVLVGKRNNIVSCIVPLQFESGYVRFLREAEYADYGDILLANESDESDLQAIIQRLMTYTSKLSLEAMRSDSLAYRSIGALSDSELIKPVITYLCDNPYVAKTDSFEAYYGTRSKKLRQEIRTTENHLNRMGKISFVEEVQGIKYLELISKLAQFHIERQDSKIGKSIFEDVPALRFFKEAPKYLNSENCQLHMSALKLNSQVVSVALSVRSKDVLYYWIPTFDQNIPKVSLGKLHIKHLVESCHRQNLDFDFMGGDEKYKYQWADDSVDVKTFVFFKSRFRKNLYLSKQHLRQYLKIRLRNNLVIKKTRIVLSKLNS